MKQIDLLEVWPDFCDYPLHRQFLHQNRDKFNKVIIVFSSSNKGVDYRNFVKEKLSQDKIIFVDSDEIPSGQDWRHIAVKTGLKHATSKWVYFMEQDFTPKGDFWVEVEDLMKRCDVFGRFQTGRLHPCCLFIKRETLDKTSQNFAARPPLWDHFGKIQKDLDEKDIIMGVIFSQYGDHMNGLSQNIHLLQSGGIPNYEPDNFKEYCKKCLELDNHPDFIRLFTKHIGGD